MRHLFNVFGQVMAIERVEDRWNGYLMGPDGKRRKVQLGIPSDVTGGELSQYLYDIYHESAAASDQDIFEITPGTTIPSPRSSS